MNPGFHDGGEGNGAQLRSADGPDSPRSTRTSCWATRCAACAFSSSMGRPRRRSGVGDSFHDRGVRQRAQCAKTGLNRKVAGIKRPELSGRSSPSEAVPSVWTEAFVTTSLRPAAAPGLMEAANRGAREAGAPPRPVCFKVRISNSSSQGAEPFSDAGTHLPVPLFAHRKMHLAHREVRNWSVSPGGFSLEPSASRNQTLFELLTHEATGEA